MLGPKGQKGGCYMATIKNMTPHTINIVTEDGREICSIPSDGIARVSSRTDVVDKIGDVPITKTVFGEVEGLPEETDGVLFIVSRMVQSAASERHDLLVPGLQVRDADGRIVGCRSLDR